MLSKYFSSKKSPFLGRFSGVRLGEKIGCFTSKNPLEREKIGEVPGGKMGTKKGHSNELLQPSRVSLFARHYARLISDGIIVTHKNSLHLHYSIPQRTRQEKFAIF